MDELNAQLESLSTTVGEMRFAQMPKNAQKKYQKRKAQRSIAEAAGRSAKTSGSPRAIRRSLVVDDKANSEMEEGAALASSNISEKEKVKEQNTMIKSNRVVKRSLRKSPRKKKKKKMDIVDFETDPVLARAKALCAAAGTSGTASEIEKVEPVTNPPELEALLARAKSLCSDAVAHIEPPKREKKTKRFRSSAVVRNKVHEVRQRSPVRARLAAPISFGSRENISKQILKQKKLAQKEQEKALAAAKAREEAAKAAAKESRQREAEKYRLKMARRLKKEQIRKAEEAAAKAEAESAKAKELEAERKRKEAEANEKRCKALERVKMRKRRLREQEKEKERAEEDRVRAVTKASAEIVRNAKREAAARLRRKRLEKEKEEQAKRERLIEIEEIARRKREDLKNRGILSSSHRKRAIEETAARLARRKAENEARERREKEERERKLKEYLDAKRRSNAAISVVRRGKRASKSPKVIRSPERYNNNTVRSISTRSASPRSPLKKRNSSRQFSTNAYVTDDRNDKGVYSLNVGHTLIQSPNNKHTMQQKLMHSPRLYTKHVNPIRNGYANSKYAQDNDLKRSPVVERNKVKKIAFAPGTSPSVLRAERKRMERRMNYARENRGIGTDLDGNGDTRLRKDFRLKNIEFSNISNLDKNKNSRTNDMGKATREMSMEEMELQRDLENEKILLESSEDDKNNDRDDELLINNPKYGDGTSLFIRRDESLSPQRLRHYQHQSPRNGSIFNDASTVGQGESPRTNDKKSTGRRRRRRRKKRKRKKWKAPPPISMLPMQNYEDEARIDRSPTSSVRSVTSRRSPRRRRRVEERSPRRRRTEERSPRREYYGNSTGLSNNQTPPRRKNGFVHSRREEIMRSRRAAKTAEPGSFRNLDGPMSPVSPHRSKHYASSGFKETSKNKGEIVASRALERARQVERDEILKKQRRQSEHRYAYTAGETRLIKPKQWRPTPL
eukprot:g3102.t1